MSNPSDAWTKDTVDAISMRVPDCNLDIQGTDGEQIEFKDDLYGKTSSNLRIEQSGRWLKVYLPHNHHSHHAKLTLKLPNSKAWVLDIFSGRSEIQARDIQARLRVMVGKGDIKINEMKGLLSVGSGQADIKIKQFIQAEMPGSPPMSQESGQPSEGAHHKAGPDGAKENSVSLVSGAFAVKTYFNTSSLP